MSSPHVNITRGAGRFAYCSGAVLAGGGLRLCIRLYMWRNPVNSCVRFAPFSFRMRERGEEAQLEKYFQQEEEEEEEVAERI
jgi:hypothetical protein